MDTSLIEQIRDNDTLHHNKPFDWMNMQCAANKVKRLPGVAHTYDYDSKIGFGVIDYDKKLYYKISFTSVNDEGKVGVIVIESEPIEKDLTVVSNVQAEDIIRLRETQGGVHWRESDKQLDRDIQTLRISEKEYKRLSGLLWEIPIFGPNFKY